MKKEKEPVEPLAGKLALTIPEAVQASSLSRSLIYRAIKAGHLKCRKYGTRTVIMQTDLTSFLTDLPTQTKSPAALNHRV